MLCILHITFVHYKTWIALQYTAQQLLLKQFYYILFHPSQARSFTHV